MPTRLRVSRETLTDMAALIRATVKSGQRVSMPSRTERNRG